jgi:multiple antibiotic resistance protein
MDHLFAIKFFGALFAIMNPLTNLPIFLSLTDGLGVAEQRSAGRKVVLNSAIMCVVVAVLGQQILRLFGIDIDSFRTAGGIVLAGIGWNMLNGEHSTSHTGTGAEREHQSAAQDITFYPMAFPILVGPGTMTALLVFLHQANGPTAYAAYVLVILATLATLGAVLHFASAIGARLSQTLRVIMIRVMGVILLAIAVEMIVESLGHLFPGLAT